MPRDRKRKRNRQQFRALTAAEEPKYLPDQRRLYDESNDICQNCGRNLKFYTHRTGLLCQICSRNDKNGEKEFKPTNAQNYLPPSSYSTNTSFANSQMINFEEDDRNFKQEKHVANPDTWQRRIYISTTAKPSDDFGIYENSYDFQAQSDHPRTTNYSSLNNAQPSLPLYEDNSNYNSYDFQDQSELQRINYYRPLNNIQPSFPPYQANPSYELLNISYDFHDQAELQRTINYRHLNNTQLSLPPNQVSSNYELLNNSYDFQDQFEHQRAINYRPLNYTQPLLSPYQANSNNEFLNANSTCHPLNQNGGHKRKRGPEDMPCKKLKYPPYETPSQFDELSQNIMLYFRDNIQTEEIFAKKMALRSRLQQIIQKRFSGCGVFVFGSSMTGFATKTSDIDMSLIFHDAKIVKNRVVRLLWELRTLFSRHRNFTNLKVINAKVSILKFQDNLSGFEIDLNINNPTGIRNSQLLRSYARLDDRVQPLILAVKFWAREHDINDAKSGTLSSYCLGLMLIHYLQCGCSPPVLPSLQVLQPDKYLSNSDVRTLELDEILPDFVSTNNKTVGQLFVGFLRYYSKQFNYEKNRISVRLGCLLPRVDKIMTKEKTLRHLIDIEEPFEQVNTARAVNNPKKVAYIKSVFDNSFNSVVQRGALGFL